MLPLFEMMMKAQNGDAVNAMAKQFGMAQEQMQQAMAYVNTRRPSVLPKACGFARTQA